MKCIKIKASSSRNFLKVCWNQVGHYFLVFLSWILLQYNFRNCRRLEGIWNSLSWETQVDSTLQKHNFMEICEEYSRDAKLIFALKKLLLSIFLSKSKFNWQLLKNSRNKSDEKSQFVKNFLKFKESSHLLKRITFSILIEKWSSIRRFIRWLILGLDALSKPN